MNKLFKKNNNYKKVLSNKELSTNKDFKILISKSIFKETKTMLLNKKYLTIIR